MELNKKQIEEYVRLGREVGDLIGLREYDILISDTLIDLKENLAEVDVDIFEKRIMIELAEQFLSKSKREQENILIHEIVHSRVCVWVAKQKQIFKSSTQFLEEDFVNDITRGIEMLLK